MASPKYLNIRIFGIERCKRQLFKGQRRVANMREPLNLVADDMMYVIGQNFSSQGRRGGGRWKGLDESTIKMKAEAGSLQRGILVDSGALHDSMTQRGDPDQELEVTPYMIRLASRLPYAEAHQRGNDHVPKRDFIRFIPSDRTRWVRICEQSIMDALTK